MEFIDSNKPEEILLTILSDLKNEKPASIIKQILTNLEFKVENNSKIRKYIAQLQVLSQLRNLDSEVKKIANNMSLFPDIRKNAAVAPIIQAIEKEKSVVEKQFSELKRDFVYQMLTVTNDSVDEIAIKTKTTVDFVLKIQKETNLSK